MGPIVQVKKSCNPKRNINRIYSKKLHYNCFQQLLTLRLNTSNQRKLAYYPVFSTEIPFYSYLIENCQKATLNFYFKSSFSVKPSKVPIYFAHDCRSNVFCGKDKKLIKSYLFRNYSPFLRYALIKELLFSLILTIYCFFVKSFKEVSISIWPVKFKGFVKQHQGLNYAHIFKFAC